MLEAAAVPARLLFSKSKFSANAKLRQSRRYWLLTAFEKKNSVLDNTMDTGETLSGERNDTATPQDTVSVDKVNQ